MKTQRAFFIVLYFSSVLGVFGNSLTLEDFRIFVKGQEPQFLYLRQEETAVLKLIGHPKEIKEQASQLYPNMVYRELHYPGCSISFLKGWDSVEKVHVFGPNFYTPRGVRIGDRESRVIELYGDGARIKDKENAKTYILYQIENAEPRESNVAMQWLMLFFEIKKGVVTEISLDLVSDS